VTDRERRAAVADYVLARPDGERWAEWLQGNRYELNAMTTLQFLAWLGGKMAEHGGGKVIPPASVLTETLMMHVAGRVERSIKERILGEARVDEQVAAAMRKVAAPDGEHLQQQVAERLTWDPERHWTDCVTDFGRELAAALAP
jgi:hypothetical protein